jgi:hypothetical protein
MPPAGLQLSGLLSTTVEFRSVTFVFPLAIQPPADPWFCRTTVPMSVVLPRFASPPPRPPDVLCRNALEMSCELPEGWVFDAGLSQAAVSNVGIPVADDQ